MSTETDSVTTAMEKGAGGIQSGVYHVESYKKASARGQLATDQFGHSLVEIDPKAEAKLRLKLDFPVLPTVAMLYLFCFIDQENIGMCSNCSGLVHNFSQACGVRLLLGMSEAGDMHGMTYDLNRWYWRSALAFRVAIYQVMAPTAGAVGGVLASAILRLDSVGSITSWRMISVIEGVMTAGIGIIAFFTLTDRPSTARWLTQEEKDMAIARIKAERVGTTNELG